MKNKRRILGIVAAALLAVLGTFALTRYARSAKDQAAASETLVDVYVVDKLVPKGADAGTIKSSVSIAHVPVRLKQPGAITNLDSVGSDVAATDLQPGDQLLDARLVAKGTVTQVVADKVQISVPLTPERAVGGSLQKGDLVGVYLSFDPFALDAAGLPDVTTSTTQPTTSSTQPTTSTTAAASDKKSPNVTRLEFQHVLVTNVQTTDAPTTATTKDSKDGAQVEQVSGSKYIVTLALSPEQSERFVFACEFGHVWLSNDPATVSDDGTRIVTLGNAFKVGKP